MNEHAKKRTIDIYLNNLRKWGESPSALGWLKGRQFIRFEVLTSIDDLNDKSILDVGCGFGDLYYFLKIKGIKFKRYLGIDINEKFINIAKKKYPDAEFLVMDIEEEDPGKFDYVISSGMFNYLVFDTQKEQTKWVKSMLKRFYDICVKGFAVDFMSTYVDFIGKGAYHANPEEIFKFCKTLSKRVTLRHDYMPYEFCVYVYKDDSINYKNVFTVFYNLVVEKYKDFIKEEDYEKFF